MSKRPRSHINDDEGDSDESPLKKHQPDLSAPSRYDALSSAQKSFVDDALRLRTHSLFLTGEAGSGKSEALNVAILKMRALTKRSLGVSASTGAAASALNATTVHRILGVQTILTQTDDIEVIHEHADGILKNPKPFLRNRLQGLTDLIIDEISMLSAQFIKNMDIFLRRVRQSPNLAFGGLRMIFCGDFFQLPPVEKSRWNQPSDREEFAFETQVWRTLPMKIHYLPAASFRHIKDPLYASMLRMIRTGEVTPEIDAALKARVLPVPESTVDGIPVAYIYPTNEEVDRVNRNKLANLTTVSHGFKAEDTRTMFLGAKEDPFRDCNLPEFIYLKKGAQVMLLRNYTRGDLEALECNVPVDPEDTQNRVLKPAERMLRVQLFNGSVGHIIRFETPDNPPLQEDEAIRQKRADDLQPVVHFVRRGMEPITVRLIRVRFEFKRMANGPVLATRTQFPLSLCWARTVNKSQGQTITCNMVGDALGSFAPGQTYTLLSRVCSLDQMYLTRYDSSAIWAHPKVKTFYKELDKNKA